jgi:tRNA pseudouridine13 synthase
MLKVPEIERSIGIEVYASETKGIGGVIKLFPEDFIVEEILTDGSRASVKLEDNVVGSLSNNGRYLICILIKRGWDTLLAIEEIAKLLNISSDRIGFAGIKDANALTAQYISIGGISPSRLAEIKLRDLLIKPLGFSNEELSPEKLFGNKFTVTVRLIRLREKTIRGRIERIGREIADLGGVPNFFGHQRFGTIRPITHIVGKHIVKGDFREAVLTFLTHQSPYEEAKVRKIRRELYETMDFKLALKNFPKSLIYERLILAHLSRSPNDYLGALHKIPLNLRKLFVQAYQSYLFNRFLSERIKRGISLKDALEGDYVIKLNDNGLPEKGFFKAEISNMRTINDGIKSGRMVLGIPLVGLKQPLSSGTQGEIEREILEDEDVSAEDFKRAQIVKVSALGGLRPALARVSDLKISIMENEKKTDGKAVIFSFTLSRGAYATILLREYMKPSTDKQLIKSGF